MSLHFGAKTFQSVKINGRPLHLGPKSCHTLPLKHIKFVNEPMLEKDITIVAGIGKAYGKKLSDKGYDKAYILFGQFLLLKRDEDDFKQYLKDEVGMNARFCRQISACFREWADQFL